MLQFNEKYKSTHYKINAINELIVNVLALGQWPQGALYLEFELSEGSGVRTLTMCLNNCPQQCQY